MRNFLFLSPNLTLLLVFLLYFIPPASAFCHPGCECLDELRRVVCENVSSIPILLHPMLKSLALRNSRALRLDPVSIGLYQELELLDLSNNSIHDIPPGFLGALKKLKELRLPNNQLKALDERLFGGGSMLQLEKLDLSNNQLDRIAPRVFADSHLDNLAFLNISGNQLHLLQPSAFTGLSRALRTLDLSKNRLARLTTNFFNETPALVELDLSGNILSELSSNLFSAQRRLQKLDLGSNLLASVDGQAFSGLYSLRELDMARNLLSTIDNKEQEEDEGDEDSGALAANWKYLPELEMIDLSGNPLRHLRGQSFQGLFSLKELLMEDMPELREVQASAFSGLINLERLDLSGCSVLTEIHPYAFGSHQIGLTSASMPSDGKLKRLDLSHNQLSTLDEHLLDWRSLKWLDLAGNRWDCRCELLAFLPEVLRGSNQTSSGVYCTQPDQLFNVRMAEIKNPAICKSLSDPFFTLLTLAALLTTLTLLMLLMLICCCRRNRKPLNTCCSPSSSQTNNHSRLPLYNTGSSFTESLIYEKGVGNGQLKAEPLMPGFAGAQPTQLRNKPRVTQQDDSGSDYYYSILPLAPSSANEAGYLQPSYTHQHHPQHCLIAQPPYLLNNRSNLALNTHSRPPSFTAPPPPPPEYAIKHQPFNSDNTYGKRIIRQGSMGDGLSSQAARHPFTRSTEVV